MEEIPFATLLRDALAFVGEHGFGVDVDSDAVIEEAAHAYLGLTK